MKPKERRFNITRQHILDTALKLVIEKGLQNFSLRELARRVNYSPTGLYVFFKNKEDIIIELHKNGFHLLTEKLNSIKRTNNSRSNLYEFGIAYLKFSAENTELYQLIFHFIPSSKNSLEELAAESNSFGILCDIMQELIDSNTFSEKNQNYKAEELAFSYWSILHGLSILPLTIVHNFDNDFSIMQDKTITIFINGLLKN